jgi:hypothetical protein
LATPQQEEQQNQWHQTKQPAEINRSTWAAVNREQVVAERQASTSNEQPEEQEQRRSDA